MSATAPALLSLLEVIDIALEECKGGTNNTVAEWIEENYPDVLALPETNNMLKHHGLCDMVGRRRKTKTPAQEARNSKNLCFDFGLPELPLDSEITIPLDLDNILGGPNEWKEPDDATLEEIDLHILYLRSFVAATETKITDWLRVRQAAAKYANGNLKLTVGELRKIARKHRKQ